MYIAMLYIIQDGVNLLQILKVEDFGRKDPGKGALKLMDVLFTDDELSSCCYKRISKRFAKPGLDNKRVKMLEGGLVHDLILASIAPRLP